jgi:hypothetical protein
MVDPNRKINLGDDSDSDSSEELQEFNENEIQLIKEFEEKFKHRFTDQDEEFMAVCKKKKKDPPILEWNFHHHHQGHKRPYYNNRGGGNRGGYHHRGRGGHPYHNNNRNYDNRKRSYHEDRNDNGNGILIDIFIPFRLSISIYFFYFRLPEET